MSLTAAPYGFRPIYHPSGQVRSNRYDGVLLPLTNVNIYKGQPVNLAIGTGGAVNGVTVAAGAVVLAPVVANNVDILGVFAGVEYTDLNGRRQVSDFFPANLNIFANTLITAWVWDDYQTVYQVQADGQFNTGLYSQYRQTNGTNFSNGSTTTGISAATVSATPVATTVQGQWRVVVPSWDIGNAVADAFTDLWVNLARPQGAAVRVSI